MGEIVAEVDDKETLIKRNKRVKIDEDTNISDPCNDDELSIRYDIGNLLIVVYILKRK